MPIQDRTVELHATENADYHLANGRVAVKPGEQNCVTIQIDPFVEISL